MNAPVAMTENARGLYVLMQDGALWRAMFDRKGRIETWAREVPVPGTHAAEDLALEAAER